jgi:hypothetical protein
VSFTHQFLNTLDATFSINLGENQKFLSMLWFVLDLCKYLVLKFVLKYNINPWGLFTLFAVGICYCGLYLVYLEIYGFTPLFRTKNPRVKCWWNWHLDTFSSTSAQFFCQMSFSNRGMQNADTLSEGLSINDVRRQGI